MKVGALWDSSSGPGAPVFVAEVPPFHPVSILARVVEGGSHEFVLSTAAVLIALCSYGALRQLRFAKSLSATAAVLMAVLAVWAGPSPALSVLGIASSLFALGWFLSLPSRGRWVILVLVVAIAMVGDSSGVLPFLILPCGVLFASLLISRRQLEQWAGATSGALVGAVVATLLSAFWWLPARELRVNRPAQRAPQPLTFALAETFVVDPRATTFPTGPDFVIVDHVPGKIRRMKITGLDEAHAGRRVKTSGGVVTSTSDSECRLEVQGQGWNLLVTNFPAWSGWRAYWNDDRIPPVTVNGAFLGSFVPPGRGELWLRYRPREFDSGIRLGLIGLLVMLATAWKPWFLRVPTPARIIFPRLAAGMGTLRSRTFRVVASSRIRKIVLLLLMFGYAAVLVRERVEVAGGADSSGYLNQARMWSRGELSVPINTLLELRLPVDYGRVFTPLGFVSGPEPGTMVPTYPPGLPLLLAAMRFIGGDAAMYLFGPIAGIATLLLMVELGREAGLSTGLGIAGAAILAAFPTFVLNALFPVSDVVTTGWAIATLIAALRTSRDWRWGFVAGALAGFGVLLRPSQIFILPAIVIAARFRPRAIMAMIAGGVPFAIFQMALFQQWYGEPFKTGYGPSGSFLSLSYFPARFAHHGYWLGALLTPLIFPLGLCSVFVRRIDRYVRFSFALWFVSLFTFYCFYESYQGWGYTRFIMPAIPALIILALLGAQSLLHALPDGPRRVSFAALLTIVVGSGLWHCDGFSVLDAAEGQETYRAATVGVQRVIPANALVLGMELSGARYYYAGETLVRWDVITPDMFTLLRTHASIAGKKWYAVLIPSEVSQATKSLPGNWVPIARFRDAIVFEVR
jgi:hypothetical protein